MKERALIRSTSQVRALQAGATQIRVPVVPQPVGGDVIVPNAWGVPGGAPFFVGRNRDSENAWRDLRCPLGVAGDQLWVRETWAPCNYFGREALGAPLFRASWPPNPTERHDAGMILEPSAWRSPVTMPRRFARLILEVVEVRAEKMDDAEANDFVREGFHCNCSVVGPFCEFPDCQSRYAEWWNAEHVEHGFAWSPDLWTWVAAVRVNR